MILISREAELNALKNMFTYFYFLGSGKKLQKNTIIEIYYFLNI